MRFAYKKPGEISDTIHDFLNQLHTIIRRIEDDPSPTFASSLGVLEETYQRREIFLGCCKMLKSMAECEGDEELMRVSAEDAIMTSAQFDIRVLLRPTLYHKIASLTNLSEQETVVWAKWKQLCEHYGTHLPEKQRSVVWKLFNEYESLASQYTKEIKADKTKLVVKKNETDGLPDYYLRQNEKKKGWIFVSARHAKYILPRCQHPRTRARIEEMMSKYLPGLEKRFLAIVKNQHKIAKGFGEKDFVSFQQYKTSAPSLGKLLKRGSKAPLAPAVVRPTVSWDQVLKVFPLNMQKWTNTRWVPTEVKDWNNATRTAYVVTGKSPHYHDPVEGICLVNISRAGGQGIRHVVLKEGGDALGALVGVVPEQLEPQHVLDLYRESMKMVIQITRSHPYHIVSGLDSYPPHLQIVPPTAMELYVINHFGEATGMEGVKKVEARLREWREGQAAQDAEIARIDQRIFREPDSKIPSYPTPHLRFEHWNESIYSHQGGLFYTKVLAYKMAKKWYASCGNEQSFMPSLDKLMTLQAL